MFNSKLHNNNNPTKDHLGSIRVVTDQARDIKQVNDYTPFGVSMKNSFSDTTNQKYKYYSTQVLFKPMPDYQVLLCNHIRQQTHGILKKDGLWLQDYFFGIYPHIRIL